jgi:hypothetical protein
MTQASGVGGGGGQGDVADGVGEIGDGKDDADGTTGLRKVPISSTIHFAEYEALVKSTGKKREDRPSDHRVAYRERGHDSNHRST